MTDTIEVISGLLTQKPGRDPEVGQIKCYSIEKRISDKGKEWLKVKNTTPDKGGLNYRILNVSETGFTDAHGNISFNVELEQVAGAPSNANHGHPSASAPLSGGMTKDDYWRAKEARDLEREPRIARAHAQEMAIRYATMKGLTQINTEELRKLIDWFLNDVQGSSNPF